MNREEAYERCKEVIDHHSKTFSKAFQYLPKEKKQAVWAIYAFCRTVDDIIDEGKNPEKEILMFEEKLDIFSQGGIPEQTFLWIALRDTFAKFNCITKPYYDMVKGQKTDLVKTHYDTYSELQEYCYHVASTVGLMLLPVLAPKKQATLRLSAIRLGIAMQITNILRDIGEDYERNRIYIPKEYRQKFGYTDEMMQKREINYQFIKMWEYSGGNCRLLLLYQFRNRLFISCKVTNPG
ncbi:phytoene/squalene synthase family protein [Evansella tamaricis]|uniref:phytoene/squalene synthase family protein n=1 Tax=Evansella tamaricis TaxID=2069301 RepID=UPI0031B8438B